MTTCPNPNATTQLIDALSFGLLSAMWLTMLIFEVRQTWRWDALGRALTMVTGALLLSYGLSFLSALVSSDLYPPRMRWVARSILFVSGALVIVILVRDQWRTHRENNRRIP